MKWVGMNGGIGSGKSTVAAMLRQRGADVIDVDVLSRELQQPGQPLFDQIVARWGAGVLDAEGRLDRPGLGRIVFADPAQLSELTAMAAPITAAEIIRRANLHLGTDDVVVMESAMQIRPSYGMTGMFLVDAPPLVALGRLVSLRGMTREDATARINGPAKRQERLDAAGFVVANDGDIDALAAQIEKLWTWIRSQPDAVPFMEDQLMHYSPRADKPEP